jgi:iron(III) transport system permease protein
MREPANRMLWFWVAAGFLAYLVLPWYAIQDANGLAQVAQVFSGEPAGNGLLQATAYGRPWLGLGLLGLAVAAAAALLPPGRRQGAILLAGGGLGLLALLASGFLIGAHGWAFDSITSDWGELGARQPGMGWGGVVALTALTTLAAFGMARRGLFKGDLFVAASVLITAGLLGLFIVFPVLKALSRLFHK